MPKALLRYHWACDATGHRSAKAYAPDGGRWEEENEAMNKQAVIDKIVELGMLAVIRGPSPELTLKMVDALVKGGVTGIEITFTTPDVLRVFTDLRDTYGDDILLGMGTLTTPEHAQQAADIGAAFVVSPHTEKELGEAMVATGLPTMMGVITPSEVAAALKLGADVVKLFPGSLTGPSYVKALRGPYPNLPIMPTGGVSAENVAAWFAAGVMAVGAGSALCPTAWAKAGRFDDITARARAFVDALEKARE